MTLMEVVTHALCTAAKYTSLLVDGLSKTCVNS